MIVITNKGVLDNRVESVHNILPHRFAEDVQVPLFLTVRHDHSSLRWRDAGGFPRKPFGTDKGPMQRSAEKYSPYPWPNLLLFDQSLRIAKPLDLGTET